MNFNTIYIEDNLKNSEITKQILNRTKTNNIISCKNYGEVFNLKNQNFKIQKSNPSLIIAEKKENFVLKTPDNFTIGFKKNYYFSHMLNCIYDCKYCFLQGMYNSANYVLFINYNDFKKKISQIANNSKEPICFFSGYDCDSLALEKLTNFVDSFLDFFRKFNNIYLEIRTKSSNIEIFKKKEVAKNIIIAFSLNPDSIINNFEIKTPSLNKRINSILELQRMGWQIGLRFDPIIYTKNFKNIYNDFFETIFEKLNPKLIHSVTIGNFRMPLRFFQKLRKIRPLDAYNFSKTMPTQKTGNKISSNKKVIDFCISKISKFVPKKLIFLN